MFTISDFDDIEVPSSVTLPESTSNTSFHVNADDELVNLSAQHVAELQRTVQRLTSQVTYIISQIFSAFVHSVIILLLYWDDVLVLHSTVGLLTY
jgi:hypothetical protein